MEDKDYINKAKEKATRILSTVSKKTEYLAKLSKLKLKISGFRATINKHYKKIGKYVFENQDNFKDNPTIKTQLEQINQLQARIEEKLEQVEELKQKQQQIKEEENK